MSTAQTRLEKNFKKFHEKNPAVWTEFKRYSFEAIESGRQHYSASLIINKIRWDSGINTSRTNAFKIAYKGLFKTFEFESDVEHQSAKSGQSEMAL